jgi:hypothetical protein
MKMKRPGAVVRPLPGQTSIPPCERKIDNAQDIASVARPPRAF